MAEKRMFAKSIVLSDAFLDMPMSTRCLYFTLSMVADDDGFVNSPKSVMRQCGASEDDMRILISKKFILVFESGVIVIKHWRLNNYLRNDRYTETNYLEEKSTLELKDGVYTKKDDSHAENSVGIPLGIPSIDKNSIDKNSIDKNSIDNTSSELKPSPVAISLPLNDKTFRDITEDEVNEYQELYPNVNVSQELRNMLGWLNANPTKRKTRRGVNKFVNGWLQRKQDSPQQTQSTPKQNEKEWTWF